MASVDIYVGRNVRRLRKKAGLTKVDLAELSAIPLDELIAGESGERRLSAQQLFKLSAALKAPVSHLLAMEDPLPLSESPERNLDGSAEDG